MNTKKIILRQSMEKIAKEDVSVRICQQPGKDWKFTVDGLSVMQVCRLMEILDLPWYLTDLLSEWELAGKTEIQASVDSREFTDHLNSIKTH